MKHLDNNIDNFHNLPKLVFATGNRHKLDEARLLIGNRFQIMSLADLGCHDEIPETGLTLKENALQKARWVKEHYGLDCFADDTGLMVDALNGEPGVFSARYAGPEHDAEANMLKLLENMAGVKNRNAHFSTVIALVSDKGELCVEGRVDGVITTEPRGENGFGYDPVFEAEDTGLTFAEMNAAQKNSISHRGRAMRRFIELDF